MFKKITFSVLSSLVVLFSFASYAKADDSLWYSQDFSGWYVKTFDDKNPTEIFGERYTAAQVQWIFYSIPAHVMTSITGGPELWLCIITKDATDCFEAALGKIKTVYNSMNSFFGLPEIADNSTKNTSLSFSPRFVYNYLYNNPLSGTGYLLRKASTMHLVPQANAQGFGYTTGASDVLKLWKISRDFAFSFLVIAVVIMAFLIMFRVKISPQTVISVQSALPKVIFAVILIAFSYAIAGVLIDLMYLVIGILSLFLSSSGISTQGAASLFQDLTNDRNVFVLCWQYIWVFAWATLATILSASFFGGILGILLWVVTFFVAIVNSFRVLVLVIKTYVTTILLIVAGPFYIVGGLLVPSLGLGAWIKAIAANLAVYPTVALLFVLAYFFLAQSLDIAGFTGLAESLTPFNLKSDFLPAQTLWEPPLTWGTNSGKFLWLVASYAVFVAIPKAGEIVKSFVQGREFNFGSALTETPGMIVKTAGTINQWAKDIRSARNPVKATTP